MSWGTPQGHLLHLGVKLLLGFNGWSVAAWLQGSPIIEPVHPFQCRELDGLEGVPCSAAVDDLGLIEAVDGFSG